MKTVRRIIAVIVLLITVLLVGYLVYTGSQFSLPDQASDTVQTITQEVSGG